MDDYTIAQAELFLREAVRNQKRESAMLAQFIIAAAFDSEAWASLTEDLKEE